MSLSRPIRQNNLLAGVTGLNIDNSLVRSAANCQLVESPDGQQPPRLEIHVNQDAFELCRALRAGPPPIYVGHGRLDEGILVINPVALTEDEVPLLGGRLMKLLAAPSPAEEDD